MEDTRLVVGSLITRIQIEPVSANMDTHTIIDILYCSQHTNPYCFPSISICRIDDFKAGPRFRSDAEIISTTLELYIPTRMVVHNHPTTQAEIQIVRQLWSSAAVTFEDWLEEVLGLPDLADSEKDRLRRAFS